VGTTPVLDLENKSQPRQHHDPFRVAAMIGRGERVMILSNGVGLAEAGHAGYVS
jgi:hypothetical protein